MGPKAVFNSNLMRRYDGHGPRYTSYPTALHFTPAFDTVAYRRAALLSNEQPAKPLSIYVHVPFCASPCFYCGCNRIITRSPVAGADYVRRLAAEIQLQAPLYDSRRVVQQLHFGGGTPTFLSMAQIGAVIDNLAHAFKLDASVAREFSIEIDPRTVSAETFLGLASLGFNRASLGVQDFDARVQQVVNRRQSESQVARALASAREAGFRSVSFDLIYGLPLQTLQSFACTLDTVISMRPDRIAAYGYAHMPQLFKAQSAVNLAQVPGSELRLQLAALTARKLGAAGYVHIGMDHFALPNDELSRALIDGELIRNFQGYSTHAQCDLIGLGISAIGAVGDSYSQNCKHLPDYYAALDSGRLPIERGLLLTTDDRLRREVIHDIMCAGIVDLQAIESRYAIQFRDYFAAELQSLRRLEADELVTTEASRIVVSPLGRLFLRNIAMVFDARLRGQQRRTYSKVI